MDGEHYPPTTRWGLDVAADRGYEVVAALFIGGSEKLAAGGRVDLGNVPVDTVKGDVGAALAEAIARHQPVAIVDLSD